MNNTVIPECFKYIIAVTVDGKPAHIVARDYKDEDNWLSNIIGKTGYGKVTRYKDLFDEIDRERVMTVDFSEDAINLH